MRFLYNVVLNVVLLLTAPFYLFKLWRRGNWQDGFSERFGDFDARVKHAVSNRHVIWLHAVSVGEVNISTQLVRELEPRVPNAKLAVSTTTSTGMGILRERLPAHILRFYYPIDRRKWVNRSLLMLHPEAIILVEAEIWPNFLWQAAAMGVPVFLANARLSEKSYRGYRRLGFLFRPLFRTFVGVGAQNDADRARLIELGCRPEAIHVVGNLKFDSAQPAGEAPFDVPLLLRRAGIPEGAPILVAGSTHAGEERILGGILMRLRQRFPNLFLIVVPRHHERAKEAAADLTDAGLRCGFRSKLRSGPGFAPGERDALVVDTTGELRFLYPCATVVFVGKSLTAEGGQNPLEPAALGKPVLFGPNMQNFAAIATALTGRGGAWQVADAAALEQAVATLLENPARAAELGRQALSFIEENRGATARTVEMIANHLRTTATYVAPPR